MIQQTLFLLDQKDTHTQSYTNSLPSLQNIQTSQGKLTTLSTHQFNNQPFYGYLGFLSKKWAAVVQSLIFGLLTLSLSLALAFLLEVWCNFTVKWSLVLATIVSAVSVGFLLYRLHGPYILKKAQDNKLRGSLRYSFTKLKIMCVMYTLIMSISAIVQMLSSQSAEQQWNRIAYIYSFLGQIVLIVSGHIWLNLKRQESTSRMHNYQMNRRVKNLEQSSSESSMNQLNIAAGVAPRPQAVQNAVQELDDFEPVINPVVCYWRDFQKTLIKILHSIAFVGIYGGIATSIMISYSSIEFMSERFWGSMAGKEGKIVLYNIVNKTLNQSINQWFVEQFGGEWKSNLNDGDKVSIERIENMMDMQRKSQAIWINSTGIKKIFFRSNRFFFGHHITYESLGQKNNSFWEVQDSNKTRKLFSSNLNPIYYPNINKLFRSDIQNDIQPTIDSQLSLDQGNLSLSYLINNVSGNQNWTIISSNGSVIANTFPKNRIINSTFINQFTANNFTQFDKFFISSLNQTPSLQIYDAENLDKDQIYLNQQGQSVKTLINLKQINKQTKFKFKKYKLTFKHTVQNSDGSIIRQRWQFFNGTQYYVDKFGEEQAINKTTIEKKFFTQSKFQQFQWNSLQNQSILVFQHQKVIYNEKNKYEFIQDRWDIFDQKNQLFRVSSSQSNILLQRTIQRLKTPGTYYSSEQSLKVKNTTIFGNNIWRISDTSRIKVQQAQSILSIKSINDQGLEQDIINYSIIVVSLSKITVKGKYLSVNGWHSEIFQMEFALHQTINYNNFKCYNYHNKQQFYQWASAYNYTYDTTINSQIWTWRQYGGRNGACCVFWSLIQFVIYKNSTKILQHVEESRGIGPTNRTIFILTDITNFTGRYINFKGHVFDRFAFKFMFNMNVSKLDNLPTFFTHPTLKISYDALNNIFRYADGSIVPTLLLDCQYCRYSKIVIRNDSGHFGQVLAHLLYYSSFPYIVQMVTPYIQWANQLQMERQKVVQFYVFSVYNLDNYNKTQMKSYNVTYFYDPQLSTVYDVGAFKHELQFSQKSYNWRWIGYYIGFGTCWSLLCAIIFNFNRQKNHIITFPYRGQSQFNTFNQKYSVSYFFINLQVIIISSFPLLFGLLFSQTYQKRTLLAHYICSILVATVIYFLLLTNWNRHTFRSRWWQIKAQIFDFESLTKSLKDLQIGDRYIKKIYNIIHKYLYSAEFINSYKVKKLLKNQTDISQLKKKLQYFVKYERLDLNSADPDDTIITQTWNLVFPQFLITFVFAVFSIISLLFQTKILILHDRVIFLLCIIFGIFSLGHFVWQHHYEVFIKQSNGSIHLRQTKMIDRLKICCLGIMLLAPVMASSLTVGYNMYEDNTKFVASLGLSTLGYIVSVGIHNFWNSRPGLMGIARSSLNIDNYST